MMILRRLFTAAALLCVPVGEASAQTGTAKTPAQLNTEINSLFPDNTVGTITPNAMRQVVLDMVASATNAASSPQGRLTLASLTPIMNSTSCGGSPCTAQTTIYYDCYAGCGVPVYNGTIAVSQQIPTEVSDALPNAGTGVVNANDVFDVWWTANTICHATNGSGGGWSADHGGSLTARGTGYSKLSRSPGFLVNASLLNNCYNGTTNLGPITVSQATYLGTFATAGSAGTVSFTFGSGASGGGAAFFGLWNYYNRVTVATNVSDISAPYTYTTNTFRQANASAGNQIQFVLGVAEDNVSANYSAEMTTTANINAVTVSGLGFDSSAALGCQPGLVFSQANAIAGGSPTVACAWNSTVGIHTIFALEKGDGVRANTFNSFSANNLSFSLRM